MAGTQLRWKATTAVSLLLALFFAFRPLSRGASPAKSVDETPCASSERERHAPTAVTAKKSVADLARELATAGTAARKCALAHELAAEPNEEATPVLATLLAERNPAVRQCAVLNMRSHLPAADDALLPLLEDRDHDVRELTAEHLAGAEDPRIIGAVLDVAKHGSMRARGDSLVALCRKHEHQAAAPISSFLDVAARDERRELLDALGECGGVDEIPTLEKWLRTSEINARMAALRSLGKIGGEGQLNALVGNLGEDDFLADVASEALLETSAGRAALVEVARRGDGTRASESAFRGLTKTDGADVDALMLAALENGSLKRTDVAVTYVTEIGLESALPQLIALARSPRGKVNGLADAIATLGGKAGALALVELARSSGPLRRECFAALETSPEGRVMVRELAIDTLWNGTGRAEAIRALSDDPSAEATEALVGAIGVRRLHGDALEALASRADADSRRALENAAERGDSVVRLAALEALGKHRNDGTMRLLERMVNDDDRKVRDAAIGLVMDEGGEASTSLLRRLLADPKRGVDDAAKAIGRSSGIPVDTLVELTKKDGRIAAAALEKLAESAPDKALEIAKRSFANARGDAKRAALTASEGAPLRARRDIVEGALRDKDLGPEAVSNLEDDGSEEALTMLRQTLENESLPIETRESAARALEEVGGKTADDVKAATARVHALTGNDTAAHENKQGNDDEPSASGTNDEP